MSYIDNKKMNYYNFEKFKSNYLLTNDLGRYIFLNEQEFKNFNDGVIKDEKLLNNLIENYFLVDKYTESIDDNLLTALKKVKGYLFEGTQLHIFVLTLQCNLGCIYCQASAGNNAVHHGKIMSFSTAERAVDLALQSPSRNLTFEFQGGEPLLNFDVLKHIVEYTKSKNLNHNIMFSLVSNLITINEEIMEYLIDNNISICTSIDGHPELHNFNRPLKNNNSFTKTMNSIFSINERLKNRGLDIKVQALQTTTRYSLKYPKEIIEQYIKLGIESIFIRPLSPFGLCSSSWHKIGYTVEEFLCFYRECLDYIIELHHKNIFIKEGHAAIFLRKILLGKDENYMELRSPCGGVLGQLAYNYDGNIYTCDEGRMLAETGDESFKVGDVFNSNYKSVRNSSTSKALCIASCLESLPGCSTCVYSPYCGVCPVCNYSLNKSLFSQTSNSYKCKLYKGMLDILFNFIQDEKILDIFYKWL